MLYQSLFFESLPFEYIIHLIWEVVCNIKIFWYTFNIKKHQNRIIFLSNTAAVSSSTCLEQALIHNNGHGKCRRLVVTCHFIITESLQQYVVSSSEHSTNKKQLLHIYYHNKCKSQYTQETQICCLGTSRPRAIVEQASKKLKYIISSNLFIFKNCICNILGFSDNQFC